MSVPICLDNSGSVTEKFKKGLQMAEISVRCFLLITSRRFLYLKSPETDVTFSVRYSDKSSLVEVKGPEHWMKFRRVLLESYKIKQVTLVMSSPFLFQNGQTSYT